MVRTPEYDTPELRARYRVFQEGASTVVKQRGRGEWSDSILINLIKFLLRWRIWSPFVAAFLKKVIALSPMRVLLKLVGGFLER
jgi:hypothetical protein